MGTLGGVFGVVLFSLGMTQVGSCFGPRVVTCTTATVLEDCNDDDPCTTDTCVVAADATEGECANTDIECLEGQECDGGTCKTPCDAADECDDDDACTDDACTDGFCGNTNNTAACDDDDACTEDDVCAEGVCAGTALVCDDGLFCNGTETCDVATGCVAGTAPCVAVTESCNEDTDACDTICAADADCDDGVFCNGAETCDLTDPANGVCAASTDPCVDNGVFCDGTESCDEATAACVSSGDPCSDPTPLCNEDTDTCDAGTACTTDADCVDDGLFCNGIDVCDTATSLCVAGEDPCAATTCPEGQTVACSEGDTAAVCSCEGEAVTYDFTLDQDNLTGSTADDTFEAPLEYNSNTGTQVATFQTGDAANGLAGTDTLNATFNTNAYTATATLSGIEVFNFTAFDDATLNATNWSDVTTVNSVDSVDDVSVTGIKRIVDAGITGLTTAGKFLYLYFADGTSTSPTTASNDVLDLTVSGMTAGQFKFRTAANGFETLNIVSTGDAANTLDLIQEIAGTSLATVNFSGAAALKVALFQYDADGVAGGETAPTNLRTYNGAVTGSVITGALTLGTGTRADATDTFTSFAAVDLSAVTGGSGDDTFILGTTLTTVDVDQSGEKIDGGAGSDTLQASLAASITTLNIDNVETLRVNATADAVSLNMLNVPDVGTIYIESDDTANTFTLSNVPVTTTTQTWPTLIYRGDGAQGANEVYDTMTYTSYGADAATGDTLAVQFNNRGTAINSTGTTYYHSLTSLTVSNIETISLAASDGPLTFSTGLTLGTVKSLTVTGSSNVTMGTVTATADSITSLNATGVTGNLSGTVDCMNGGTIQLGSGNDTVDTTGSAATALVIYGNAGNDTLTGAASDDNIQGGAGTDTLTGAAGADTISGGDDNDTIVGGAGIDTLSGGNGSDTFAFNTIILAANAENISDFVAGAGGDIIRLDATTFTDYTAGATVTLDTTAAIANAAQTAAVDSVVIVDVAADILVNTPAAGAQHVIAIASDTGNIYYCAAGVCAGAVVIGNIPTAQVASLVAANFLIQ
ncbi:MAG: calcium-binding protein [Planctomycetota bacterium]